MTFWSMIMGDDQSDLLAAGSDVQKPSGIPVLLFFRCIACGFYSTRRPTL